MLEMVMFVSAWHPGRPDQQVPIHATMSNTGQYCNEVINLHPGFANRMGTRPQCGIRPPSFEPKRPGRPWWSTGNSAVKRFPLLLPAASSPADLRAEIHRVALRIHVRSFPSLYRVRGLTTRPCHLKPLCHSVTACSYAAQNGGFKILSQNSISLHWEALPRLSTPRSLHGRGQKCGPGPPEQL